MEEVLVYFALKYHGEFDMIFKALEDKEVVDPELKKELFASCKSSYTTIISEDYPEILRSINCPPFVLFYYGDLSLLDRDCTGVVGMRHPSLYGIQATKTLVTGLCDHGHTIVSGMALGIDSVAHYSAIEAKGATVAVLGGGIDYPYPKRHQELYEILKKDHLVISEYPNDLVPRKDGFPKRNRIIAGVSDQLLVCEANERSGTMITVGFALEQGKDIFAVPSGIFDSIGCNRLIQQGAKLVNDVSDILDELN